MINQQITLVSETNLENILLDDAVIFRVEIDANADLLISKLEKDAKRVRQFAKAKDGIVAGAIKDMLFLNKKLDSSCKKLYFGKHLSKYCLNNTSVWVNYKPNEMMKEEIKRQGEKRPGLWMRDEEIFKREKIIYRKVAKHLIATYDKGGLFYEQTIHSVHVVDKKIKTKYILGLFNSSLLKFYYQKTNSQGGNIFPQIRISSVENLPMKIADDITQGKIEAIVDYILYAKNEKIICSFFESLVDAAIYEIYLPSEIETAGCEVLKLLVNLPEVKDDWSDEKKLAVIKKVYKELSDPKHPVSIAMAKMQEVPEVRIIEGREKN